MDSLILEDIALEDLVKYRDKLDKEIKEKTKKRLEELTNKNKEYEGRYFADPEGFTFYYISHVKGGNDFYGEIIELNGIYVQLEDYLYLEDVSDLIEIPKDSWNAAKIKLIENFKKEIEELN